MVKIKDFKKFGEGHVPHPPCHAPMQGRSQTFISGGPSGRKGGQAKFSKYFSLVENHLKLVLKFEKEIFYK